MFFQVTVFPPKSFEMKKTEIFSDQWFIKLIFILNIYCDITGKRVSCDNENRFHPNKQFYRMETLNPAILYVNSGNSSIKILFVEIIALILICI